MDQRLLLASSILAVTLPALPRFENIGSRARLDFKLTSGSPSKAHILESMGGGVGLIDYDNDGWVDVFLVNGSTLEAERAGTSRLFRNNHNGTFADVTDNQILTIEEK